MSTGLASSAAAESRVVRLRGIAKRLTALDIPTRQGLARWCLSAAGKLLESGVSAGTAFEDLPQGWVCPQCGALKEQFSRLCA